MPLTARLATHPDMVSRAADVLDRLMAAGVDVELVADSGPDAESGDPLRDVREGHLDIAVVGLWALRGSGADGLTMVAALPREDARDALVTVDGPAAPLRTLPRGARVGVTGARQTAFLKLHRTDLEAVPLGSDLTAALAPGGPLGVAAVVLPSWRARRLGLAGRTAEVLDARSWLPAPGQGVVALLARHPIAEVTALDHLPTRTALRAELALLDALDFGPEVAFGSLAQPSGRLMRLWAAVASVDGRRLVRSDLTGPLDEPELLGASVARQLTQRGASIVLEAAAS
jgi:hydroxymethylbilane synthase